MTTPSPRDEYEAALTFLRRAGVALCDTGVPVSHVTDRLQAVASRFGLDDVTIFVLPTGVLLSLSDGRTAVSRALGTAPGGSSFRLDQLTALQQLLDAVTRGRVSAVHAVERLQAIEAQPARYNLFLMLAGHALFGLGFGLLLQPTLLILPVYAVLAALAGLGQILIGSRRPSAAVLYPALAAFAVTAVVNLVAPATGLDPSQALIAPLVFLLPTAAMTYAVIDLSRGDSISGAARFATSAQRFVLLGLGAYIATEFVPVREPSAPEPVLVWGPWLGVGVFCIGLVLTQSGELLKLPYLLGIAYLTFAVQYAVTQVSGTVMGSIAAGAASIVAASAFQRLPHGPPSYTGFVPVLWLIVPGAAGLHSVVDFGLRGTVGGAGEIGQAALTIVALSVGILLGFTLTRHGKPPRVRRTGLTRPVHWRSRKRR